MEKKNKWWITKIMGKLEGSFDNSSNGFSARKLTAWSAVMISMYITVHYTDATVLVNVLGIWLVFALLCLGIITAEQIIRFKDGATDKPNDAEGDDASKKNPIIQNEEQAPDADPKL